MRDLTQGKEASTILKFAIPMLIGNVFQQLYSTVDGIVVGRGVGKEALAAVGASFPIIFFMVSMVIGVSMGATVLLSQFFGAKDFPRMRKTMDTTYIFLFVASMAVTVLGLALSGPILRAIRIPQAVFPLARDYLRIMFAGMFFLFGYNTIGAILRGLGDSRTPLYFLIIATVVNIALDLVFVLGLGWGVAGAAWATVIAQAVSFVIGLVYMQRSRYSFLRNNLRTIRFDREIFRKILKIGLPSGVQNSLVSLGFIALTRIVNPFGTSVIAGYTAASRLGSFAAMPAMNISIALSTFVGQNLGAGKPERVRRGYLSALLMAGTISVVMSAVMVLARGQLISIFNADAGVIEIGSQYLLIVSPFYLVFAAMFVTGGVLRGAGATMMQMISTILALWVIRIPFAAIFAPILGTAGIWWGVPAGWVCGFGISFGYYLTGRWKSKVVARPMRGEPATEP